MSLPTRAVVFDPATRKTQLQTLTLAEPVADQVQVKIVATGVCHSDLHIVDGDWPVDTPLVLGHEGAGVVEAVGPLVRDVRVGDHVVLSWFAPCRRCDACAAGRAWLCANTTATANTLPDGSTPYAEDVLPFLGVGTFSEYVVVPEAAAITVADDVPLDVASLIGCAVTTGVGAVTNTAGVRPGESGVVIGVGGVGQAAVLGLALVGADPIVAVDLSGPRLELASELGATHTLRGDDPALAERVLEITGGAHHVFEAIGRVPTIESMPGLLRAGGQAVIVGMTGFDASVSLNPFDLADRGISVLGCNYGSSVPSVDFPRIAALHRSGRLPLSRLVGSGGTLDDVERAFADLRAGAGLRTVLRP
ncbi:alcohol dehydrogenase catalytic domain-containing protein [Kineosporia succinea]|uniref:S-(Hydroxymethyl)glutathione dehydrogenase/alcohol dehydrogenase n=1 Tax=Kineosporia succinea TaxID=84632 RepID=A0ABT9NVE1_9ACTN|nr:alcohol dehydrogenase catalytic domain-containing protein [Kineosporia succinea]MDP9824391.1 S-(hydroxymethyl)glutathione dehydrogenase/alcohol dehydrogenase [Kineosporia succinea]